MSQRPFFQLRVELVDGRTSVAVVGAGVASINDMAGMLASAAIAVEQRVQEVADSTGYPVFLQLVETQKEHLRAGNLKARAVSSRYVELPKEPPHDRADDTPNP